MHPGIMNELSVRVGIMDLGTRRITRYYNGRAVRVCERLFLLCEGLKEGIRIPFTSSTMLAIEATVSDLIFI